MKNFLATLMIVLVAFIAGCKKDDFEEIIGVCPVVVTTDPLNGAVGVPVDQRIRVTFNEPMNGVTFTDSSFTLSGPNQVTGIISYSDATVTFSPSKNLEPFTLYTGRVKQSVKDIHGNALQTDYVWSFTTGAIGVNLFTNTRFGILAGSAVNSLGFGQINNMDVGISPATRAAITGFPPANVVNGDIYASNDLLPVGTGAMLIQAKLDLNNAWQQAKNLTVPAGNILSGDQGGKTLTPGVYHTTSGFLIQSGNLTLDAQGDPNAYWVFQVDTDLVTIGRDVLLINGAKANNVIWQVGSSATIGTNTSFKGNILALTSITLNPNASVTGRLLALNGAVILSDTNIINKP
ncbi:MAG: DUF3494 domain-containing protein [Saprospiraceae bacterium]|nr:DUF3494 domain-containing protein [Saprospiraceae bacterium]